MSADLKKMTFLNHKISNNFDSALELKIRDYIDECINQKLNLIKSSLISELISCMEEQNETLSKSLH